MKNAFTFILLAHLTWSAAWAQTDVKNLRCENLVNPLGLDVLAPRFSWELTSHSRNTMQTAFEIRVSANSAALVNGKELTWASGKRISDVSVQVVYGGPALEAAKKYYWQVRIWDDHGQVSAWSSVAFWQMGMLRESDWKAKWIEPGFPEDSVQRPSPLFRKTFVITKKVKSATVFVTAHGLYEATINGKRVGDAYLTPGWTSYTKRLAYQTYDVTGLLKDQKNAIGVELASGWYRGYIGFSDKKDFYGRDVALLLQLQIRFEDGTDLMVGSDSSWKSSTGAILSAEIYNGESIDARKEQLGWQGAEFDDSRWISAKVASFGYRNLVSGFWPLIKSHEEFKPIRIFTTTSGQQVIDFGQNLVGWVRIKAKGAPGDRITVKHAEVLDKTGNFYTENLRMAKATDVYTLRGTVEETFEPHFTFHGFRYVLVDGFPGDLKPENFTAVALYSDLEPCGKFQTSMPLLNQLQHNIQWGQRGNFLDVPTDCPQRDERLGWTGDAQVFSRTACFNMNVNMFFAKWLKDLAADQNTNGIVPFVIPDVIRAPVGSAGWADAATIIPWNVYLAYGDLRVLQDQYKSMKAWVEYIHQVSRNDLWNSGFHFGDWLFYRPQDDNDGRSAVTDKYLIAQCFYAHSTQLLINAASVLGYTEDAHFYSTLLQKIKSAFVREYVTTSGRLVSGTQTAYVLALQFDMLPDSLRSQAATRLVENIKSYDTHLTTGFLGTPYLCHVLSRFGHTDVAYQLLLQETYPSWLYPVKMGATTIWERWDGIKPDSSFQTPAMNSFNHYAYGAIGDWMYRVIAGIDTYADGPGYKHIRIMPHPGGGLHEVSATLKTYFGEVTSAWKIDQQRFILDVIIPPNTKASVFLPCKGGQGVTESGTLLSTIKDLQIVGTNEEYLELSLGSGSYHFQCPFDTVSRN